VCFHFYSIGQYFRDFSSYWLYIVLVITIASFLSLTFVLILALKLTSLDVTLIFSFPLFVVISVPSPFIESKLHPPPLVVHINCHPTFQHFRNVCLISKANLITYHDPTMVANTLYVVVIALLDTHY